MAVIARSALRDAAIQVLLFLHTNPQTKPGSPRRKEHSSRRRTFVFARSAFRDAAIQVLVVMRKTWIATAKRYAASRRRAFVFARSVLCDAAIQVLVVDCRIAKIKPGSPRPNASRPREDKRSSLRGAFFATRQSRCWLCIIAHQKQNLDRHG